MQRGERGGDVVDAGGIGCALIQAEFRPATAINDPATISDLYAIAALTNGQVVVDGMFQATVP